MKKVTFALLTFLFVFSFMFVSNAGTANAASDEILTVSQTITVSAVSNGSTDENKDHTVTVKGALKNEGSEDIANIVLILDVETAYMKLAGQLQVKISKIEAGKSFMINLSTEAAEKFVSIKKITASYDGKASFVLVDTEKSGGSGSSFFDDLEETNPWMNMAVLGIMLALAGVAIPLSIRSAKQNAALRDTQEQHQSEKTLTTKK